MSKAKTQFQEPPKKPPARVVVLETDEEPVGARPSTLTSPPGGKQPPPIKPAKPTTAEHGPEAEAILIGGPDDGQQVTLADAKKYLNRGFGYRNLSNNRVYGSPELVEVSEKTKAQPLPSQITKEDYQRLAQKTKTMPTAERPEIVSTYPEDVKQALSEIDHKIATSSSAKERLLAQTIKKQIEQKAKEAEKEKNGPITKQTDLVAVAKMINTFKQAYYEGYADMAKGLRLQEGTWEHHLHKGAEYMERCQIAGIQYGMTVFNDVFRGTDLATKDFFFRALGPLGAILEKYNQTLIGFNMDYHRGRAWWSPERLNYLIKELPEEKFYEFLFDQGKNVVYLITKLSGTPLFSKITELDPYGRERGTYLAFKPYVHIKNYAHGLAGALDRASTEGFAVLGGKHNLSDYENDFYKAEKEFYHVLDNPLRSKGLGMPKHLYKKMVDAEQNLILAKREVFGGPSFLHLFSKNRILQDRARDQLRARFFRSLGLKGLAKGLRRDARDPIGWLAIVVGSWIGDLIFGNIGRLVVEKIIASRLGSLFLSKYVTTGQLSLGALESFGKAAFSLNTFGGGIVGYGIGGPIGGALGAGGGWAWQTIRNFGLSPQRMEWVRQYYDLQKWPDVLSQKYVLGPKISNPPTIIKLGRFEWQIKGWSGHLFGDAFTPGPISRIAYWLNTGTTSFSLGGLTIKIPIGRLLQPIPSVFVNGTLVRWYVSPFLTELGTQLGWDPFIIDIINNGVVQYGVPYLWEIKGLIGQGLGGALNFGYRNLLFSGGQNYYLWGEIGAPRVTLSSGGPGIGYVYEGNAIRAVVYDAGPTGFYIQEVSGVYGRVLGIKANFLKFYDLTFNQPFYRFLGQHTTLTKTLNITGRYFQNLGKIGPTNILGAFAGWELFSFLFPGNFLAPFVGAGLGWVLTNPILTMAGMFLNKLGLLPETIGVAGFVSSFSTGYLVGAGIQLVAGLFGVSLPFWFAPVVGLTFTFGPFLLMGAGFLIQPIALGVGNFLVMAGTIATGTIGMLATLSAVAGIASVAALAVFAIVIVGSAFWIPFQENLQGITSQSLCFDIGTPIINGKNEQAFFKNGEKKEICWTTTNKTPLYQGPIVKSKVFDPPGSFSIDAYRVTVAGPDGKTIVGWNNAPGQNGNYSMSTEPYFTYGASPGGDPSLIPSGITFKVTPPLDAGGAQCIEQLMSGEISDIDQSVKNAETLINERIALLVTMDVLEKTLSQLELEYLNTSPFTKERLDAAETSILARVPGSDEIARLTRTGISNYEINNNISPGKLSMCYIWKQRSASPSPPAMPVPNCNELLAELKPPSKESLTGDLKDFFARTKTLTPAQVQDAKKGIEAQRSSLSLAASSFSKYKKTVEEIKKIPPLPPNATDQQKQTRNNQLKKIAEDMCRGNNNFYLPVGSTITACLDVTFRGKDGTPANINEKDSAQIPLLGPVSTNLCQAQLPLSVNAGPSGNILWPTNKNPNITTTSGDGHYRYDPQAPPNQNHTGIDIPGSFGDPVLAATNGTVVEIGTEPNGFGNYIIIKGSGGEYYIYGHLGGGTNTDWRAPGLAVGAAVRAGDTIGKMGNSGRASGVHLHFGMSTRPGVKSFWNNSPYTLNPCGYIAGGCP